MTQQIVNIHKEKAPYAESECELTLKFTILPAAKLFSLFLFAVTSSETIFSSRGR